MLFNLICGFSPSKRAHRLGALWAPRGHGHIDRPPENAVSPAGRFDPGFLSWMSTERNVYNRLTLEPIAGGHLA